ncbi:hypothetical protein P692DRAFT_20870451 [Suillus brevipes Sb2]|nr:hypothetical protein P692DRAFT_20870451 [Suillus brevipes Sb2]
MHHKSSRPKKPSEKAAAMASSHSRNNTWSRPPKSKASPKHVGKRKKAPSSEEESPSESDDSIVKEMHCTSKKKVATKRVWRQSQAAIEVVEDSGREYSVDPRELLLKQILRRSVRRESVES